MVFRWQNPAKVPRAELIVNLFSRQIEMIDSGRAPSKAPRQYRKTKIKPLLKNCNYAVAKVIVISKQKHGVVLSHPRAKQPISFGSD